MRTHIARLYEQGAGISGIGRYVRRWVGWVLGGLQGVDCIGLWEHVTSVIVGITIPRYGT